MPTILEIIESRLIPDEQAKKARGEVFTPLNLVRELLYGLRKSDFDNGDMLPWGVDKDGNVAEDDDDDRIGGIPLEFWRDPDTKWLDPANGIGNFPFVAFHMLDYQLKHHGIHGSKDWSDEVRRRHIVGNMLYMIELDRGNVNTAVKIFRQIVPGLTPNILCADTLSLKEADIKRHFEVSKFHVIMGNPPFQDDPDRPNKKGDEVKKAAPRKGGQGKLYERFTIRMLDLLTPNGFLGFITPDNIFSGTGLKTYTQLVKYNIPIINLAGIQTRHFKGVIGQSVCYFLVQNAEHTDNTTIISQSGAFETMVKARPINPVREWTEETDAFIDKFISNEKNGFEYNRGGSATDYTGGKYEVIYTPTTILSTDDISLAPGHGKPLKVVLFESKPKESAVYDPEGKYGVGPHTFYYIADTDERAKKFVEFTKSPDYMKLLNLTLTSQYLKSSLVQHLNMDVIAGDVSGGKKRQTLRKKHQSTRVTKRVLISKTNLHS
jgi:hypothetical protein